MSNFARNGENSNSAICVSVYKSDYGATPEAAIEFQRSLERAAFAAGGGDFFAPASTAGDFLRGTCGAAHGRVHPTYMGGRTRPANLRALFPAALSDALADGCAHSEKNCRGLTRPTRCSPAWKRAPARRCGSCAPTRLPCARPAIFTRAVRARATREALRPPRSTA